LSAAELTMVASSTDTIPLNDLARATESLGAELIGALARVVESGWYLQGPEKEAFEDELASFVGTSCCIGVGSGTDALELALRGVGCSAGDEVLTAPNAGMYTTTAALRAQLRVRYADVDAETLCLSRDSVERALGPETRTVVVTHLYGRLADVEAIADLCEERGIALIEDCAQSIGASRNGRQAGSFGDAAAFSFYPTKNLGALGDAGAVVTNRHDVAERVRSLAQYGWGAKYHVVSEGGRNSRLDEVQAAVLRVQLPHLADRNARRRGLVRRYTQSLSEQSGVFVATESDDYVGHLAVFLARDRASATMTLNERGVATDVHYPVLDHQQPVWKGAYDDVNLPVAEAAVRRILTVPCFPELRDDELDRICAALEHV
jgi:aminotransferase EvaB